MNIYLCLCMLKVACPTILVCTLGKYGNNGEYGGE